MLNVEEHNTVLVKVLQSDILSFDQNDFIELFLDKGPLNYLCDFLFGLTTHNYQTKIYAINFLNNTSPIIIENFLKRYEEPFSIATADGQHITLQTTLPPKPLQMITLHPMPFSVTHQHLLSLTRSWGVLEKSAFGRHKRYPAFRNSYLHLHFKNVNPASIPDTIRVNNKYVTVMIQGEEHIPRCGYCKQKFHVTSDCPIISNNSSNPGPSGKTSNIYQSGVIGKPRTSLQPQFSKKNMSYAQATKNTFHGPQPNEQSTNENPLNEQLSNVPPRKLDSQQNDKSATKNAANERPEITQDLTEPNDQTLLSEQHQQLEELFATIPQINQNLSNAPLHLSSPDHVMDVADIHSPDGPKISSPPLSPKKSFLSNEQHAQEHHVSPESKNLDCSESETSDDNEIQSTMSNTDFSDSDVRGTAGTVSCQQNENPPYFTNVTSQKKGKRKKISTQTDSSDTKSLSQKSKRTKNKAGRERHHFTL